MHGIAGAKARGARRTAGQGSGAWAIIESSRAARKRNGRIGRMRDANDGSFGMCDFEPGPAGAFKRLFRSLANGCGLGLRGRFLSGLFSAFV
jgi:hypothetical protein